jgi:hypothetical protein
MEQMKEMRIQLSQMSQRVEQKASFMNLRNIELQLQDYAKLANLQIVQDAVDAKANTFEVKRLTGDFSLHQIEFEDLKQRFNATLDT